MRYNSILVTLRLIIVTRYKDFHALLHGILELPPLAVYMNIVCVIVFDKTHQQNLSEIDRNSWSEKIYPGKEIIIIASGTNIGKGFKRKI